MILTGEEMYENVLIWKVTKLSDRCSEVKTAIFVSVRGLEVE